MPQQDDYIEQIHRLEGLMACAEAHGDGDKLGVDELGVVEFGVGVWSWSGELESGVSFT